MKQSQKNHIRIAMGVITFILVFTAFVAGTNVGNIENNQRVDARDVIHERRVEWVTVEYARIQHHRIEIVVDMLKTGQITPEEHTRLDDQCILEIQTIPQRIPF